MASGYSDYRAALRESRDLMNEKMVPVIHKHFVKMYQDSVKMSKEENGKASAEQIFDMGLDEIPNWNSILIEKKTNEIIKEIPNLKNILKLNTLSLICVIGSIRISSSANQDTLDAKVPAVEKFIHHVFIEAAKDADVKTYKESSERNRNAIYESYKFIGNAIPRALRSIVKPEEVLSKYLETIAMKKEYGSIPAAPQAPRTPREAPRTAPLTPREAPPAPPTPRTPVPDEGKVKEYGLEKRKELDRKDKEIIDGEEEEEEEEEEETKKISLKKESLTYQPAKEEEEEGEDVEEDSDEYV